MPAPLAPALAPSRGNPSKPNPLQPNPSHHAAFDHLSDLAVRLAALSALRARVPIHATERTWARFGPATIRYAGG